MVGASLRNRRAVARWLTEQAGPTEQTGRVVVIAAGERWPDGSLRPPIEDLWARAP